jgi:hypothetical protein
MCSRARHRTTASKVKLRNGSCSAAACTNRGGPPRMCASRICEGVGSRPTTSAPPRAMHRATCPSPHPTSRTRRAFRRCFWTRGRICSSYSGSAPSVNLRCHHLECCSQRESPITAARLATSQSVSPGSWPSERRTTSPFRKRSGPGGWRSSKGSEVR